MKKLLLAFAGLMLPFLAVAQFSVSGKITDSKTGETLPGATITIQNQNQVADAQGYYLIKNVSGKVTIKVRYIGYTAGQLAVDVKADITQNFQLQKSITSTDEVNVTATRASKTAATTFTNVTKKDLEKNNLGQDLPFLLNQTPSAVITSDAGTGVGYTSIHIRGTDATRTNVTLNGIPLNDAEDQGAYFVDLPDLASSVDNIQVQRGVGTSTNGAGAFGASINMQTNIRRDTGYAELNNTFGSFGTIKNTVSLGSGLIGDHFQFDGRLSRIKSNGYIDRASSDLKSYFLSGAYYGKNTTIRANVFSGYEKTYQAWDGVPEEMMDTHRTYNELGLESDGSFYPNQTDNYTQNYAQLLVGQKLSNVLTFNGALHYTRGFGYYEEYKQANDDSNPVTAYGLDPVKLGFTTTDLVRRLWLDNDFYGLTYAFDFHPTDKFKGILGGAYNEYKGRHHNNIEWSQDNLQVKPDYEYSRNNAKKTDFNIFSKGELAVAKFRFSLDLQYRHIDYSFLGFDQNLKNVQQNVKLDYFNPKAGVTYLFNDNTNVYGSFAIANHEPNRADFTNSTPASRPKSENLKDLEIGYRTKGSGYNFGINGYYMSYKNQLVLTGALNDVGEAIRSNVDDSYRMGLELDGRVKVASWVNWAGNIALSQNKVKNFTQYLFNHYDAADYNKYTIVSKQYGTTDLAYSPNVVGYSEFGFVPVKGAEIAFITKYVGKQYIDNTSNTDPDGYKAENFNGGPSNRYLDGYWVNNLRLSYHIATKPIKNIGVTVLVNNVFNKLYSTNGAVYPEIDAGTLYNIKYYYPQATRNLLVSLSLAF